MNKTRLLACPSCSRHVRASETACPFCRGELPASFATATAPRAPGRRLSRAALYAFGATSVGIATACGGSFSSGEQMDSSTSTDGASPGDSGSGSDTSTKALYGGPPSDDAEPDEGVVAAYGAPAIDGSFSDDASEDGPSGEADGGTGTSDGGMHGEGDGGAHLDSGPNPDSGTKPDGGTHLDSGTHFDGGVHALYGGPPVEDASLFDDVRSIAAYGASP